MTPTTRPTDAELVELLNMASGFARQAYSAHFAKRLADTAAALEAAPDRATVIEGAARARYDALRYDALWDNLSEGGETWNTATPATRDVYRAEAAFFYTAFGGK